MAAWAVLSAPPDGVTADPSRGWFLRVEWPLDVGDIA
jgi:hypothetical protein